MKTLVDSGYRSRVDLPKSSLDFSNVSLDGHFRGRIARSLNISERRLPRVVFLGEEVLQAHGCLETKVEQKLPSFRIEVRKFPVMF